MKLPTVRFTQKGILFVVGLLGVAHETLVSQADRPTLLLLFAAMIGLPAFLKADEVGGEKSQSSQKTEAE